ncbi:MAG: amidohydrolase [Bryobacteraceae bacterium]
MRMVTASLFILLAAQIAVSETPECIYYNGKVVTVGNIPRAEAFAVKGARFLAVGSTEAMRKLAGPSTKLVDLKGRTVLPGLMDSHTHPITAALSEKDGAIPTFHTIADVQSYVTKLAKSQKTEQTIYVPKVYASRLQDLRYPTRQDLDKAAPGRVVLLDTGYNAVLSSAALAKVSIDRDTKQPANGRIQKDAAGEPNGLILGAAQLWSSLKPPSTASVEEQVRALQKMQTAYNAVGITSTVDRGLNAEGFRVYQELQKRGGITVRSNLTFLMDGTGDPKELTRTIEAIPFVTGFGDDWVRVGAIKVVADGGILLGTAYLREPYGTHTEVYGYEDPHYRGVLAVPAANLVEMARTANRLGWQMTAHTTGGGATDLLLDAYEAANREHSIVGRRFTVTHGNFPNAQAIARAKKLGVAFDVQPAWLHLDGHVMKNVFGPDRIRDFLPLRTLLDQGLVVVGGSDHMIRFDSREAINPYNPFFGMWMAITRRTADGAVLHPEQAITREEALRMWTSSGAYLTFEEKVKGSIEVGKLADFVVISKDFAKCPVDEIKDIEALLTVVGGRTVYQAPAY